MSTPPPVSSLPSEQQNTLPPAPASVPGGLANGGNAMDWQPPAEVPPRVEPAKEQARTNLSEPPPANMPQPVGVPPPPTPPIWTAPPPAGLPSILPAIPATAPEHQPNTPHPYEAALPQRSLVSPAPAAQPMPPAPPSDQTGASSPTGANAALYRPLNVKDALSYLEMVKVKFQDKPDVYNHFLDIMKDFKSQSIDTPGVIDRVSSLFTGHPTLIQGFNTFLPQGYRIDCSSEGTETNLITVTTPSGTTTQTSDGTIRHHAPRLPGSTPVGSPGLTGGPLGSFFPPGQSTHPRPSTPATTYTIPPAGPEGQTQQFNNPTPSSSLKKPTWKGPGPMIPSNGMALDPPAHSSTHPTTPGAVALLGGLQPLQDSSALGSGGAGNGSRDAKRPVEFGHAINYVNKIKNRFAGDPDTYKQFLEILQTYQKEQRPIKAVYEQVTVLFNNATDLLEEFKQFLPDPSSGAQEQSGGLMGLMQASGPSDKATRGPVDKAKDRKPAVGSVEKDRDVKNIPPVVEKPAQNKRRKRVSDKEPPPPPVPVKVVPSNPIPSSSNTNGPPKPKKSKHHHHGRADAHSPAPYIHESPDQMQSNALGISKSHPSTSYHGNGSAPTDEQAFFDRVKKYIDDRRTYDEFLKLLHLFTEEIIDVKTLVDRASNFLGGDGSDLFGVFKDIVGWGERTIMDADSNAPFPPARGVVGVVPTADRPRVDLNACRKYGPSYRKLPKHEVNLACSGRDAMCWEVLNDEWVSHPTWASEDAGFSTHKKNQFEDALHKSEEERHEYDFHIEAVIRTINVLEPINTRINMMDAEDRATFKLKPGLGGQGKSIYQRIIKKVYGRDHGLEVIQALHDSPAIAIPVVLSRLKQKEEEWKRAQREWNKVWREVDARNFYKSLDHQGINFKVNDKKSINPKQLVLDIETKRRELEVERAKSIDPAYARTLPRYHYAFKLDSTEVLQDTLKLVFSYLDRASVTSYSVASDARAVEKFLRDFVPSFFMLDPDEFCAAFGGLDPSLNAGRKDDDGPNGAIHELGSDMDIAMSGADGEEDGMAVDGDDVASSTSNAQTAGGRKKRGGDLRKKMFKDSKGKKGSHKKGAGSSTPQSLRGSPSPAQSPAPPDVSMDGGDDNSSINGSNQGDKGKSKAVPTAMAGSGDHVWIRHGEEVTAQPAATSKPAAKSGRKGTFFANNAFYVLLRDLQLLYSRLHAAKAHSVELSGLTQGQASGESAQASSSSQQANQPSARPHAYLANPLAVSLGLHDSTGAGASHLIASGPNPAGMFYEHMLDCCEQLFDGEMDQATFEDHLRFMFGTRAYALFTVDKVVAAIVKQVQAILSDVKNKELLTLLRKERSNEVPYTLQEQINARRTAEQTIGREENMYRVAWVNDQKLMQIQLLGPEDPSTDDAETMLDRWKQYMASYVLGHETEGLAEPVKAPFLKRSLLHLGVDSAVPEIPAEEDANGKHGLGTSKSQALSVKPATVLASQFKVRSKSGTAIKVCLRTYRMFFEVGGEDWFYRKRKSEQVATLRTKTVECGRQRKTQWTAWVAGRDGQDKDVEMV